MLALFVLLHRSTNQTINQTNIYIAPTKRVFTKALITGKHKKEIYITYIQDSFYTYTSSNR